MPVLHLSRVLPVSPPSSCGGGDATSSKCSVSPPLSVSLGASEPKVAALVLPGTADADAAAAFAFGVSFPTSTRRGPVLQPLGSAQASMVHRNSSMAPNAKGAPGRNGSGESVLVKAEKIHA